MTRTNTVDLDLLEGMTFRARTGSGHELVVDSGADSFGGNAGARPVELVLLASAACMAMDAVSILRKMRQDVRAYHVHAEGTRAAEHPRVFTAITLTHRFDGDVRAANAARALQLSMTRYCPVFAMLSPTVPIRVRYEIALPDGTVVSGEVEREGPEAAAG